MPLPLAGRRVGPYDVQDLLGAGGMGEVYRARDTRLGRAVAMKVLPADVAGSPDRLARFEREAKLVAALSHPNILSLFDVGTSEGTAWAVFELLEGETLRGRIAAGTVPARRAVEIAIGIARGLAAAHAKGIVHRDLKPENVFLTRDGGVKVLDFGLARQDSGPALEAFSHVPTEEQLTEAGKVLGTVGYMAPEQVRGAKTDARSDLFSLGCVLYETLVGRRPFTGASAAEALASVLREEPAPLPSPEPLPGLERVVMRCLEKDPARRFQSGDDLAFALEGLLGLPSGTGPPQGAGTPTRSGEPGRRLPFWVAAAAAVALLALGAAAGRLLPGRGKPTAAPTIARVSFRRGSVFHARFAPDGRTVFYSAAFDGGPPEVYETRLGSPEARPLGLAPANLLAISPGGEMAIAQRPTFAFTWLQPGRLARLPPTGGVPRELVDDVNAADWTPDGKELVLARGVDGTTRIEWPLGTKLYETQAGIGSLRVSPRGDRLAFFEYGQEKAAEEAAVVVLDRGGTRVSLSKGWQPMSGGLGWSPDGREVWVTVSGPSDEWARLWAIGLDGTRRLVLDVPGGSRLQDVAADGRVLITQLNARLSLYVGEENGGVDRDLSWFGFSAVNDLTSEGRGVLFSDNGSPDEKQFPLFLRPTDGGPALRLGDGFSTFGGRLSPDGRWVAALSSGSNPAIRVEPTGAGEPRQLPRGDVAFIHSWSWLPDGSGLVMVGTRADGTRVLVEQQLDGSMPRALAGHCDAGSIVVSPDGRLVACATALGILVHPRDGSAGREIRTSERVGTLIRWSADGQAVFSYRQGDRTGAILRTDLATGRVGVFRRLQPADPTGVWRIHPIAVTSDGRRWAYTASRWLGDLLVYSGVR